MSERTLAKATGHGFTVLPNRVIDALLGASGKHTSDSLALVAYLVRHIPSQSGTLALAGDFSQSAICEDLGWGTTNRARLKRALSDLEAAGVVTSELRDNNTPILHVTAELRDGRGSMASLAAGEGGQEDSLHGAAKNPSPPPCQDFLRASRSPASSSSSYANKNSNLNNHHLEKPRDIPADARESPHDDDDILRLLDLYRSELKKPVSPKIAATFAENYALNGRPFALVQSGFLALARHPKLLAETTSPNAVWELGYMQKQARQFDARVRLHLDGASRRFTGEELAAGLARELKAIAEAHAQSVAVCLDFFRPDVDRLVDERAAERDRYSAWSNEAPAGDDHSASDKVDDAVPDAAPTKAPLAVLDPEDLDDDPVDASLVEPEEPKRGSEDDEHDAASLQTELPASPCETASPHLGPNSEEMRDKNEFEPCEDQTPPLANVGHALDGPTLNVSFRPCDASAGSQSESCSVPVPKRPPYPAEFAAARNKVELQRMIVKALREDLPPDMQRRIAVLAEFAVLEKTSFDTLQRLLRLHDVSTGAGSSRLKSAA